jgi:hypothetical protein
LETFRPRSHEFGRGQFQPVERSSSFMGQIHGPV